MSQKKDPPQDPAALRRAAEERLAESRRTGSVAPEDVTRELPRLVHELQVHQIELELQNEELRRARAEVEEGLARYTELYELAPVGYLTLTRDGTIQQMNLTGARLLGAERARLVGRRFGLLVGAEDRPAFAAFLAKVLDGGDTQVCEVTVGGGGATALTLELTGTASDGGPPCRVVATDVTDRKRAETAQQAMQARLAQADRLASMGMLAAGIAHELNNPLTYLLFHVELLAQEVPMLAEVASRCLSALREHVSDEAAQRIAGDGAALLAPARLQELRASAADALEGARRVTAVSRALRTFSRDEEAERSEVDVVKALRLAATIAHNEIKHRARLVEELEAVPPVWGSEAKLSQVFLNLLVNAAHAIEEGHADDNRIEVRTSLDGADVVVEIRDTGGGIAAADRDRIFEPFVSTKPFGAGSGLGLPICKSIVTEHEGDIRVESEVGRGTRVVVRLPAHRVASEEPRDAANAGAAVAPDAAAPAGRGRILVVDDEAPIRAMMKRLLGKQHEVVAVGSGKEARALLDGDRAFDVILCDLMMPSMSGMDLHAWLAERDPALAERVVFVTGGAFTPRAAEYLAKVGNLTLDKPVDRALLERVVAERISSPRQAGRS